MSNLIRLGAGIMGANALLATDSYLITDWTRTADMSASDEWFATEPEKGMRSEHVASLELGVGGFYGNYSGMIEFVMLTPLMRDYIEGTVLGGIGIGVVTAYLHNPRDPYEMDVFRCEMVSPLVLGNDEYERWDNNRYWNVRYALRRATVQPLFLLQVGTTSQILSSDGDSHYFGAR